MCGQYTAGEITLSGRRLLQTGATAMGPFAARATVHMLEVHLAGRRLMGSVSTWLFLGTVLIATVGAVATVLLLH